MFRFGLVFAIYIFGYLRRGGDPGVNISSVTEFEYCPMPAPRAHLASRCGSFSHACASNRANAATGKGARRRCCCVRAAPGMAIGALPCCRDITESSNASASSSSSLSHSDQFCGGATGEHGDGGDAAYGGGP